MYSKFMHRIGSQKKIIYLLQKTIISFYLLTPFNIHFTNKKLVQQTLKII